MDFYQANEKLNKLEKIGRFPHTQIAKARNFLEYLPAEPEIVALLPSDISFIYKKDKKFLELSLRANETVSVFYYKNCDEYFVGKMEFFEASEKVKKFINSA